MAPFLRPISRVQGAIAVCPRQLHKRIARSQRPTLHPRLEPLHPLCRRPMGKPLRRDTTPAHLLNPVIPYGRRGPQPGLHIALLQQIPLKSVEFAPAPSRRNFPKNIFSLTAPAWPQGTECAVPLAAMANGRRSWEVLGQAERASASLFCERWPGLFCQIKFIQGVGAGTVQRGGSGLHQPRYWSMTARAARWTASKSSGWGRRHSMMAWLTRGQISRSRGR